MRKVLVFFVAITLTAYSQELSGVYEGTYTLPSGNAKLVLNLRELAYPNIVAEFHFSSLPGRDNIKTGAFTMKGTYDRDSKDLVLKEDSWIDKP